MTTNEILSIAGQYIGLSRIAYGIHSMRMGTESRSAESWQRHEEYMDESLRRHEENMLALKTLIERTAR